MSNFQDGYEFFVEHSSEILSASMSDEYIMSVNEEIEKLIKDLNSLEGFQTSSKMLKGDIAEFWHSGTFNIDAVLKDSKNRAYVDRSHDFASTDISTTFGDKYGLKYYGNAQASAQAQATSIFQRFKEYQSKGGKETLDEFLTKRGYQSEKILNDPIYSGQIRIIPRDQLEEATKWLEKMIKTESLRRPEQVHRYEETLRLLRDRLSDGNGVESIPLSKEEAEKLASLAKKGSLDAVDLGLTTEKLMQYEYIIQQSFKAGMTSAIISIVLKLGPELYKAIDYLIKSGELDETEFKRIGFVALSSGAEGFIRGSVAAGLTAISKSGLLGNAFKTIDSTIIGAATVITINVIKNSYEVACNKKYRFELINELIKDTYLTACSLIGGGISQCLIELPIIGYMVGSLIGSIIGSFTYDNGYKTVISFCVETGFTLFGLVEQDYSLPKEILDDLGYDLFEYEKFEYDEFEYNKFELGKFEYDKFEPETFKVNFLRRGVIEVSKIGYII